MVADDAKAHLITHFHYKYCMHIIDSVTVGQMYCNRTGIKSLNAGLYFLIFFGSPDANCLPGDMSVQENCNFI